MLDAAPGFSVTEARRLLGDRICSVPRLRQRLYRAPPGCGRPYWADDPAFDVDEHVRQVCCPPPGDERALLDLAEDRLTFGGAAVRAIIPIPTTTGNVTVTFAASSYAGTLRVTILSDPARIPDAPALAGALRLELSAPG